MINGLYTVSFLHDFIVISRFYLLRAFDGRLSKKLRGRLQVLRFRQGFCKKEYGHIEIIKLLIENNAAVNKRSHYWETPSTLARVRGHKAALEFLLSKGGVALERTEVCYRQDLFKGSGVSDDDLKFCGLYGDDEDDDNEDYDVVSIGSHAMED